MNSNNIVATILASLMLVVGGRWLYLEMNRDLVVPLASKSSLKKYIKKAVINDPDKLVVFLQNGFILDNEGDELFFDDSVIVNEVRKNIVEKDWSYIVVGLPCLEPECLSQFYETSIGLQQLNPNLVIFHANSSGLNTDIIGSGLKNSNIPVVVYGTELGLDYRMYVGIDNKLMGKRMGIWLANEAKRIPNKPSVVFLHTLKGIKYDPYENGEPRIEAAKAESIDFINEIKVDSTFWSSSKAYDIIKGLDEAPDYIVAPSPTVAQGVLKAVEDRDWLDTTKILVLGADPWSLERIRDGKIKAILPGNFGKQAEKITDFIINNEFKNPRTKYRRTYSGDVITRDNLFEILESDGSVKW